MRFEGFLLTDKTKQRGTKKERTVTGLSTQLIAFSLFVNSFNT